jgi:hypothetical protein
MKNVLTIFLVLLIAIGAIGAAYYFLFLREKQDTQEEEIATQDYADSDYEQTSDDECPEGYVCLGGSGIPTLPTITLGSSKLLAQEEAELETEEEEEEEPSESEETGSTEEEITSNTPQNVLITNKDFRIWSIAWVTQEAQTGYIKYGISSDDLTREVLDDRDLDIGNLQERFTHHVTVTNPESDLSEEDQTYYFEIVSGGEEFDDDGSVYSYKNAPLTSSPSSPTSIGITVSSSVSGYSNDDYIVIARQVDTEGDISTPVSDVFNSTGGVELTIGIARTQSLTTYFPYSSSNTLDVKVYGPDGYTGFAGSVALSSLEEEVLVINTSRSGYSGSTFSSSYGSSYSIGEGEEEFPTTDLPQTGSEDSWLFYSIWGIVIFLLGICCAIVFIPWNYQRLWERKVVDVVESD